MRKNAHAPREGALVPAHQLQVGRRHLQPNRQDGELFQLGSRACRRDRDGGTERQVPVVVVIVLTMVVLFCVVET